MLPRSQKSSPKAQQIWDSKKIKQQQKPKQKQSKKTQNKKETNQKTNQT